MSKFEFHLIRSISAVDGFKLIAQFDDGTIRLYDVGHLFAKHEVFRIFEKNPALFAKVKIDTGGYGVVWNSDLDLSSNEIWANGEKVKNSFNGLLSFSDASNIWNLNESTLRKALSYGKLKAGTDCCKYGKQWVVSREAMLREYGDPKYKYSVDESSDWETMCVAEQEHPYLK